MSQRQWSRKLGIWQQQNHTLLVGSLHWHDKCRLTPAVFKSDVNVAWYQHIESIQTALGGERNKSGGSKARLVEVVRWNTSWCRQQVDVLPRRVRLTLNISLDNLRNSHIGEFASENQAYQTRYNRSSYYDYMRIGQATQEIKNMCQSFSIATCKDYNPYFVDSTFTLR